MTTEITGDNIQKSAHTLPKLPIGEFMVTQGLCDESEINGAIEQQNRTGGRLGEILQANVGIRALDYYRALSKFYELPFVNLVLRKPDPSLQNPLERDLYTRHLVLPVYRDHDGHVVVATSNPSKETFAFILRHWGTGAKIVVTSKFDLFWSLQSVFDEVYTNEIISELYENDPEKSALHTFTKDQTNFVFGTIAVYIIVLFANYPTATLITNIFFTLTVSVVLLYKFYLAAVGFTLPKPSAKDIPPLENELNLPLYTIMVPMYKERRVTIENLVESLQRLDYPTHRLDIKLVVEADDPETTKIIKSLRLPSQFEIVRVPVSEPRTKPKACNYALKFARGELITIYDAEDEPDPNQLKYIVQAFKDGDDKLACIQCALNYYNSRENWLTRMFTMEYTFWFDLMLPAMSKLQLPIPLGGTSNHFRTEFLKRIVAWDPFNVTEDADIGIRMSRLGFQSRVLPSTTYEEATSRVGTWIKQRSRWVKGYMQTYLVHMRHPVQLYRELGGKGFLAFQLFVGGTVFSNLSNLILWTIFGVTLTYGSDVQSSAILEVAWFNFFVGNVLLLGLNLLAVVRRSRYDLAILVFTVPIYWFLASLASYRALYQLVRNPSYWDKTQHGMSAHARRDERDRALNESA